MRSNTITSTGRPSSAQSSSEIHLVSLETCGRDLLVFEVRLAIDHPAVGADSTELIRRHGLPAHVDHYAQACAAKRPHERTEA